MTTTTITSDLALLMEERRADAERQTEQRAAEQRQRERDEAGERQRDLVADLTDNFTEELRAALRYQLEDRESIHDGSTYHHAVATFGDGFALQQAYRYRPIWRLMHDDGFTCEFTRNELDDGKTRDADLLDALNEYTAWRTTHPATPDQQPATETPKPLTDYASVSEALHAPRLSITTRTGEPGGADYPATTVHYGVRVRAWTDIALLIEDDRNGKGRTVQHLIPWHAIVSIEPLA